MTESRLAELLTAWQAHRLQLARAAGDMAEIGNTMADMALRLDRMRLKFDSEVCMKASTEASRIAHELALGLERIDRMAEPALEDTRPMSVEEIAEINGDEG